MNSVVMIAPIPAQVKAAKSAGLRTIAFWDIAHVDPFYNPMAIEALSLADIAIDIDLRTGAALIDRIRELEAGGLTRYEMFLGGPQGYENAFYSAARAFGKLKNPIETIDLFSDKSQMRRALAQSSSLSIQYRRVSGIGELREALAERQRPVIVKPARSTGSQNIHLVKTGEDEVKVLNAFETDFEKDLLVEEFFEGVQFSVEALSTGGRHFIIGITEKFPVLPPHFIEVGGVFPAQIAERDQAHLIRATNELLSLTGVQNGATHTELILVKEPGAEPRAVIVESHLRAAGIVPYMIESALGLSLYEQMLRALFEEIEPAAPTRNHVSVLSVLEFEPGRVVREIQGVEALSQLPFVHKHVIRPKPGQRIIKAQSNFERHGYIIVSGETHRRAEANLKKALATLKPIYEDESEKEVPSHA